MSNADDGSNSTSRLWMWQEGLIIHPRKPFWWSRSGGRLEHPEKSVVCLDGLCEVIFVY